MEDGRTTPECRRRAPRSVHSPSACPGGAIRVRHGTAAGPRPSSRKNRPGPGRAASGGGQRPGRERDDAEPRRSRPRRTRRRPVAGPAAGLHRGRRPLARPRHRSQHGHLQPRQRHHPARVADRAAGAGGQPLPATRRRSPTARSPTPTSRTSATAPSRSSATSGPRSSCPRRSTARWAAGVGILPAEAVTGNYFPMLGDRGGARTHPAAERRRLARRASGGDARPPLLAERLRRRSGRRRTARCGSAAGRTP